MKWSHNPKIYEINTWVWLNTLSDEYGEEITLANVPKGVLDELASYHVDAIWLMGVWYRGQNTRNSALNYVHEYRGALPDITDEDVAGSAYAIGAYQVQEALGGREGMMTFREELHKRGLLLMLDFVPNHTGLDHPWLLERPDYYIHGDKGWLQETTNEFFAIEDTAGREQVIAHGRDPYFPGWIDTAQLNAFSQGYRQAAVRTLREIATLADGVRCDMAMLMLNDVFLKTWSWLGIDDAPEVDFWNYVMPQVKDKHPDFLFIAEAYWNLNYVLQEQGFDYTYDKTMYDRLLRGDTNGVRLHLSADMDYLQHQIRFIENHDEPRAAEAFGIEPSRAAATIINTLPGATLLHDGQFTGRKVKLPVQINRQSHERKYPALKEFYLDLLYETQDEVYRTGEWTMFRCYAVEEGYEGDYNLLCYGWQQDDDYRLVAVNLSSEWSQAMIDLSPWHAALDGHDWRLLDVLHRTYREEDGDFLQQEGLYMELEPFQPVIYRFTPMKERRVKQRYMQSRAEK